MKVYYYRSPQIRMFGDDRPIEFKYEDIIAFCPDIMVPGTSLDFRMSYSFDNYKLVPFSVFNITSKYWKHLNKKDVPMFHKNCVEFFKNQNIEIEVSEKEFNV